MSLPVTEVDQAEATGEEQPVCRLVPVFVRGTFLDEEGWAVEPGGEAKLIGRNNLPNREDSRSMSRWHLELALTRADGLQFTNVGSTRPFVNGVEVERGPLKHQDVVRTGDVLSVVNVEPVDLGHPNHPPGLICKAASTRSAFQQVQRVAQHETPVLILGPTGSGKESLARQVHESSRRKGGPFVAVNCGALDPNLITSELFGHVKGAFTGANADRPGYIAQAEGGTLFLDEIGDMLQGAQVALLRALQEQTYRPVGDTKDHKCNVRIVAATNRPLDELQTAGRFRSDFLARIEGCVIHAAPITTRREEILLLIQHWWRARFDHASGPLLTPEGAEALLLHDWPHNARGVQHVAERLYQFGTPDEILPADVVRRCMTARTDSPAPSPAPAPLNERERFKDTDKAYWEQLLGKHNGNKSAIARELHCAERTVYFFAQERFRLDPATFRRPPKPRGAGRRG